MSRRSALPPLAAVAALALLAGGCGENGSGSGKPEVVASFYPLQYVAERVAGDHASITNLTPPGVEPHDLELSPRQTARVSGAEVVFYEKGLQPAVDDAVRNDPPEHAVDAAALVELHHDEERQDDGHDHEGTDPHFWLDPTELAHVAEAFTGSIVEADPANAAAYRAADEELQGDLRALDEEFRAGLSQCRTRTLVVSHDAFGYLARRYDLDVHPIAGLSPGAEPSPRHLAEISDLIRSDDVTTVFTERLAGTQLADTLASDLDLETAVLDPLEGLADPEAQGDYLSLMRENLEAIRKAGSCT